MNRTRLLLVFGGRSAEHEVSIRSAQEVLKAADADRFDVVALGIDRQGVMRTGPVDMGLTEMIAVGQVITDLTELQVDVALPVLHGPGGEDGSLQGFFRTLGLPFVGSDVASSALCMDKDWLKRVASTHGIPILPWCTVTRSDWADEAGRARVRNAIADGPGLPCFVKPANLGSSVGVHRVRGAEELEPALADALSFDTRVVVEKAIDAREIEVAVLGNGGPETRVSRPGEILVPAGRWYDYDTKYLKEDAQLKIPADLPSDVTESLRSLARSVFQIANCKGLCRVDFLVERDSLAIYLNEPNTLPGFTTASMYPKLMEDAGVSYSQLVTELVELALQHFAERSALKLER